LSIKPSTQRRARANQLAFGGFLLVDEAERVRLDCGFLGMKNGCVLLRSKGREWRISDNLVNAFCWL
jgi:hypothetical protein